MKKGRYIIVGAPGSGKGTQAENIRKNSEVEHISTGDILRLEVDRKSVTGLKVAELMKTGTLIADEIVNELMLKQLLEHEFFLLDGYPRTLSQAVLLDTVLGALKRDIDAVIFLNVSEQSVIRNICGRRLCKGCGAIFHAVNRQPKKEDTCDHCATPLTIRADDTEVTAKKRYDVFMASTMPIIDHYRQKNKLIEIDGNGTIEHIYAAIERKLS
jgi:adenylate kinase